MIYQKVEQFSKYVRNYVKLVCLKGYIVFVQKRVDQNQIIQVGAILKEKPQTASTKISFLTNVTRTSLFPFMHS